MRPRFTLTRASDLAELLIGRVLTDAWAALRMLPANDSHWPGVA